MGHSLITKKNFFIIILFLTFTVYSSLPDCSEQSSDKFKKCFRLSSHGITWFFDKEYKHGKFVNGDYWVVGPVKIIHINPPFIKKNGKFINGAMIDPDPADFPGDVNQHQGYGETVSHYDPAYNAALPDGKAVSKNNPIIIKPGSCIISTISSPGSGYGISPNENESYDKHLKTAAILTVLNEIPEKNSFRPGYCSLNKVVCFNESQLKYSNLKKLKISRTILKAMLNDYHIRAKGKPISAVGALENVADFFERPWLDHIPLHYGRSLHPIDNMPCYGKYISDYIGIGAVMLHLDFTNEQKKDLLVRFVQLGIDLYSICSRRGGTNMWVANGGHGSGRKWPILFSGIMLNDKNGMMQIGKRSGDYAKSNGVFQVDLPNDYIHFAEDDQTFYVSLKQINAHASYSHEPENYTPPDKGISNDPKYNPPPQYKDNQGPQRFYPYRKRDLGLPEYGQKHWSYKKGAMSYDSKFWWSGYRFVNSPSWSGFVFAAHAMNAKKLWNHNALFDYVDRWIEVSHYDKFSSHFIREVWFRHRKNFGNVWKSNKHYL